MNPDPEPSSHSVTMTHLPNPGFVSVQKLAIRQGQLLWWLVSYLENENLTCKMVLDRRCRVQTSQKDSSVSFALKLLSSVDHYWSWRYGLLSSAIALVETYWLLQVSHLHADDVAYDDLVPKPRTFSLKAVRAPPLGASLRTAFLRCLTREHLHETADLLKAAVGSRGLSVHRYTFYANVGRLHRHHRCHRRRRNHRQDAWFESLQSHNLPMAPATLKLYWSSQKLCQEQRQRSLGRQRHLHRN